MISDQLIARSLTWRYLIALILVAMLATAAWMSLHLVISEQESNAAIVNISGRQRMLSQRTALFSSLLANAPPGQRDGIRQKLRDAASLMKRSHQGLLHGDPKMGLPPTMSETMRTMYYGEPLALNDQVVSYLSHVEALLELPDEQLNPEHSHLQAIIAASPARLVTSLDKAVTQYQMEGEAAILRLLRAETIVWLITLLLLVSFYTVAVIRYRQGLQVAKFFMYAIVPYLTFRSIFILGLAGVPSPFSLLEPSGFGLLMQNSNTAQAIGLCCEALIMALAVVSRARWLQEQLAVNLKAQQELIEGQNRKLEATVAERTAELASQHKELDEAHQMLVGSVNYASRLQRGQLPRALRLEGRFASFDVIWEPRDTIGGDLWWVSSSKHEGPFVLAVADCTGHGVPGAMLSLLVSNSLERIYATDTDYDPVAALQLLDHYVRTGLNQDRPDSESDDGCDAAIVRIDPERQRLEYAGAKLELWQLKSSGEVLRHPAARISLGYSQRLTEDDRPEIQVIAYGKDDTFVIITDGFTDQIGGPNDRRVSYGYRRLQSVLTSKANASVAEIAKTMKADFDFWQGTNLRRDDVTAVVFRL